MRIGVFSKFDSSGGSEFRCAEMANALSRLPGFSAVLLAERDIPARIRAVVSDLVEVQDRVFLKPDLEHFYGVDRLLIVNTDSKDFTSLDYWHGKSPRHAFAVDLNRVRSMTFLFNFIVSPSIKLSTLSAHVPDIRIITANKKFFDEIDAQQRYCEVRHLPRLQLESPIDLRSISIEKSPSATIRIGMHSKPLGNKWNSEIREVIHQVNHRHGSQVAWDFMGMPTAVAETIRDIPNVTIRKEFSVPVKDYLMGIDVFLYFQGWKREEAWSRSAAEALASGCPVLAIPRGGNRDQIVHGENGYLCSSTDDFIRHCSLLIEQPEVRSRLRSQAIARAQDFSSEQVIQRFLAFLR